MKIIFENWNKFLLTEEAKKSMFIGPSSGAPSGKRKKSGKDQAPTPFGMLINGVKLEEDERWILGVNNESGECAKRIKKANDPKMLRDMKALLRSRGIKGRRNLARKAAELVAKKGAQAVNVCAKKHWGTEELVTTINAGFKRVYEKSDDWYNKVIMMDIFMGTANPMKKFGGPGSAEAKRRGADQYWNFLKSMPEYKILSALGILNTRTLPLYIEDLSAGPTGETDEEGNTYHPQGSRDKGQNPGHGSHQNGQNADIAYFMLPGAEMTAKSTFKIVQQDPSISKRTSRRPAGASKKGYYSPYQGKNRGDVGQIVLKRGRKRTSVPVSSNPSDTTYQEEFAGQAPHVGRPCDLLNPCDEKTEVCINDKCMPLEAPSTENLEIELGEKYKELESLPPESAEDSEPGLGSVKLRRENLLKEIDRIHKLIARLKRVRPTPERDIPIKLEKEKRFKELRDLVYNKFLGSIDAHRTWQLISGMVDAGYITRILIDKSLHPQLKRAAIIAGEKSKWAAAKIRHWPNHKNHIHVIVDAKESKARGIAHQRKHRRTKDKSHPMGNYNAMKRLVARNKKNWKSRTVIGTRKPGKPIKVRRRK